jgi:hypothetical protein
MVSALSLPETVPEILPQISISTQHIHTMTWWHHTFRKPVWAAQFQWSQEQHIPVLLDEEGREDRWEGGKFGVSGTYTNFMARGHYLRTPST